MKGSEPTPDSVREPIPHLSTKGGTTQLIVDGRPFLIIGGELHNSSSSSLGYMEPIWERLVTLQLNTVLAAVSWELVEPYEGSFDWTIVDGLIQAARRHNLRLILLWFGSWKNGASSYVPLWVKQNYYRFPRARRQDGQAVEVLSTFAEANVHADARAFAALLRHLRDVDGQDHTVIMVQVENEVGLLGDSRDRSDIANTKFASPVPAELIDKLNRHQNELGEELRQRWALSGYATSGSWEQVFGVGPETDEIFMAWHYACYIDTIAAAGKSEYSLPMFVNAWLNAVADLPGFPAGGKTPGDWPSGGPLPHTRDIWQAGAPHIDLLAPDIYFGDFQEWCRKYTHRGNPLFIPEMRSTEEGARNVFYAIGAHNAIGVSPFGVDSIMDPLNAPIRTSYALLRQIAPLILEHQGGGVFGFVIDVEHPYITHELGGYELTIALDRGYGSNTEHGYGLIMATAPDTFIGAGYGFRVSFRPTTPGPALVGIAAVDEGEYLNEQWAPARRFNGDETFSGAFWRFPAVSAGVDALPALGAGSAIAHCTVYRYE